MKSGTWDLENPCSSTNHRSNSGQMNITHIQIMKAELAKGVKQDRIETVT